MAKVLVIEGDKVTPLDKTKFTEEAKLQDYLEKYPSLIPLGEVVEGASALLCIGREVSAGPGSIDLLFIDKDSLLTVVETKLAKNPEARRTVAGQIIEYASYISEWTVDDVYKVANDYLKSDKIATKYKGLSLYDAMEKVTKSNFSNEDFRANIEQNLKKGSIRLIIAVDELVEPLRATVTFLNKNSNFDVLLLQVKNFEESKSRRVLVPSLFGYATKPNPPRKSHINEQIFLAHCREGEHKKAEELYSKATELKDRRKDNGDFINWGVSGYSYRIPWKGNPAGETIFVGYENGSLSLWLYIIEKNNEIGRRYLGRLRNIADLSSKVGDYKKHREPSFSTDKVTTADIDAFISAVDELGKYLNAETSK